MATTKRRKPVNVAKASNREIAKELKVLNRQLKQMSKLGNFGFAGRPGRYVGIQFFVGIIRGLGSVVGATIVVAILLYILNQFEITQAIVELLKNGQ